MVLGSRGHKLSCSMAIQFCLASNCTFFNVDTALIRKQFDEALSLMTNNVICSHCYMNSVGTVEAAKSICKVGLIGHWFRRLGMWSMFSSPEIVLECSHLHWHYIKYSGIIDLLCVAPLLSVQCFINSAVLAVCGYEVHLQALVLCACSKRTGWAADLCCPYPDAVLTM